MPANSGGFVIAMCVIADLVCEYTGDHADVYLCKDCKKEFRWKGRDEPSCIYCESVNFTLLRKKSEF